MPSTASTSHRAMQRLSVLPARTLRSTNGSFSSSARGVTSVSRQSFSRQPLSSRCHQLRSFSSTTSRARPSSGDQVKHRTGPFSFRSAALFVGTGAAMVFYFQYEKARLERKRIVEMSKGYGKPKVGGPFKLRDLDGSEFTENDILGKYSLIYFGFSHCPDICPDELDKMSLAIDIIQQKSPNSLRSIFITCDPARDTPEVLRDYLAEFHPSIQGLTGTWAETKEVCRQYRVYFSTPQDLKKGEEDYLVDHSIYFYVMDPEGDFVECIGRQDTAESASSIILEHMRDWEREGKKIDKAPIPWHNAKKDVVAPTRTSERAPAAA